MNGYRSAETGKRMVIWLIIRALGLVIFIMSDILAIRKEQTLEIVMLSGFSISFTLHLFDLLLRLARAGELEKVPR